MNAASEYYDSVFAKRSADCAEDNYSFPIYAARCAEAIETRSGICYIYTVGLYFTR